MNCIIFEKLTDVKMPNKAHSTDAGIDFYIPESIDYVKEKGKNIFIDEQNGIKRIMIGAGMSCLIPMGVKCKFDNKYALVFFNRSGVATKKHLLRGACIIDPAYRGEVFVNINNVSSETQYLEAGEKLIQAMLLPIIPCEIIESKVENDTDRGEGGFGSSDNK